MTRIVAHIARACRRSRYHCIPKLSEVLR